MPCTISISLTPNTRHQERKQRMRVARFSFLLISYCFTLLNISEAGQGEQLRRLIRSKRSSWPPQSNPWPTLDATEAASRVYVSPQDGLMQADKIRALPRQPKCVDFDQYAGYVTVNEEKGRALFYYFVESPHNSSRKPLVLWLNGGPGCSSLGYGAMQELGPFRVKSDGKTLERNQYAWNNVANVLFLESPAGVGFSYSNTTSDYNLSGDKRTAKDSYTFLINWLERFPQYKHREFYITGESYGGHYVPQLALLILRRNKLANHTLINLKGIAIGNAYVDDGTNEKGTYEHLWSHAVISDETFATIRKACNFSGEESEECIKATDIAGTEAGRIDYYNIYAPICLGTNSSSKSGVAMADVDPCSDSYVTTYLNSPDVQKALHANVTKIDGPWEGCSDLPWSDAPTSTLSTIKTLINGGLRVWLYSGDTDSVCPYRATSDEIRMLKLPIKNSWRAWYSNNEVGGYVVGYEGLTFVTVRGAGHMVPTYQPERAITMLSSFLHGKLPPAS